MYDFYEIWNQLKQLDEDYLVEAPLSDGQNLTTHMNKHVLRPGEAYNPNSPKFTSRMSEEDYVNSAIELAKTEVYGTSDMKWVSIVGWQDEPQGNKPCYVKLRWRALPEHMPLDARGTKFPAEIVYYNSLDNISIDNINTYYLIKNVSIPSKLKTKIGDIPTNENNKT